MAMMLEPIEDAWSSYHGDPRDPADEEAIRAQLTTFRATYGVPYCGVPAELPGMIKDEHGCWVSDRDDPLFETIPELRRGCAREW